MCVRICLFLTLNLSDSKFEQICLRGKDFKNAFTGMMRKGRQIKKDLFHVLIVEITEIIVKFLLNSREH